MPAMPPGHGDEDAWAIAAFVRQLPAVTPDRYRAVVADFEARQARAGHGSGDGDGEESARDGH